MTAVTMVGYEFTTRFGDQTCEDWLYCRIRFQADGTDSAHDEYLFLGPADRYEISDDGQELTMCDGGPVTFSFSTAFGCFIDSVIEKGFDESELPDLEAGEPLTLTALIGYRFRLKVAADQKAIKTLGRHVTGTGKNKHECDRMHIVVDAVLAPNHSAAGSPSEQR